MLCTTCGQIAGTPAALCSRLQHHACMACNTSGLLAKSSCPRMPWGLWHGCHGRPYRQAIFTSLVGHASFAHLCTLHPAACSGSRVPGTLAVCQLYKSGELHVMDQTCQPDRFGPFSVPKTVPYAMMPPTAAAPHHKDKQLHTEGLLCVQELEFILMLPAADQLMRLSSRLQWPNVH